MADIDVQSCKPHSPHPCPEPHHCHEQHHCPPDHPCPRQDFELSDGVKITVNKGQEVNHDFILQPNRFKDFGTISGFVKDRNGHPIANALVKVFDHNHHPFAHVFTNREGQFLICVPPGHFIIKAVR